MRWQKRGLLQIGIIFTSMALFLVLVSWTSVSLAHAQTAILRVMMPSAVAVQATPTEDATVTALNKEKLAQEVLQLKEQNEPNPLDWLRTNASIFLSTLVVVVGGLYRANLSKTSLRGAHLSGTELGGANLRGTDLRGTDLGGADLRGAILGGVNLLHASSLKHANLCGAKGLTKEQLEACKAKGAIIDEDPISASHLTVAPSSPPQSNDTQAPSAPPAQEITPSSDPDGSNTASSQPDPES